MSDQRANRTSDEPSAETDRSDSQHQAEKLELENKMLRGVLDSMADNISIKDLKGRYIFDNSAHCRFLGATKTSEVVGKTVFDFLPSDIAAKFYAEDLQVLQSGEPLVRCVDPSVDSAGNRVWMSVTKMPLRDEDGRLLGLVSATHDITARKDAEEQLARYAEKLREKNAQLEEDLETARELQNALLPQQYPRFPSSSAPENSALRFHHFFRSCSGVAGDFFHVCQISDSVAGVFISDVMGHGVRAALVAAMLRTLVEDSRAYATEPSRFLQELNRGISEILKHTHLPIFVSACYLVVDVARGRLLYANAGHPAPLWVRRYTAERRAAPSSCVKVRSCAWDLCRCRVSRPLVRALRRRHSPAFHRRTIRSPRGRFAIFRSDRVTEMRTSTGRPWCWRTLQATRRGGSAVRCRKGLRR